MPKSAIATQRKKPQTPAQRLRTLDPDLAALFDQWEADLDRDYDLALNDNPAPPILDEEEKLAFELGRFHLAADPLLEVADRVRESRDAAYMVLGRVEHLIAQRTLEALQLTPQSALPPPPPDDDDDEDARIDEALRHIHEDARDQAAVTAEIIDAEPTRAVTTADAVPTGRKHHRYGRGWWAGAAAWCVGLPTIAFAGFVGACTLLRWGT